MIYYCKDCDEFFDEDDAYLEDVGFWSNFWGHDVYKEEYDMKCPYCHRDNFEEAQTCDKCGEYFRPDELDDDCLCEDCRENKENKNNGRNKS